MLATFVWPNWLADSALWFLWFSAISVWAFEVIRSSLRVGSLMQVTTAESSKAFTTAQREYLRGNWFDAEALLLEIVHQQPRDAEAALLLVGVLRHTRRWQPALRRLNQLELLDTALPWRFEIDQEKKLIEQAMARELAEAADEDAEREGGEGAPLEAS